MNNFRGRIGGAVLAASVLLLTLASAAYPSYDTEAGRKLSIARERVDDLKRSKKRQKYRSYWIDCIRTFELVEKKYPRSPSAAEACLERGALYRDLYGISKLAKDRAESVKVYASCQTAYPKHPRAPEALFRALEGALAAPRDAASAGRFSGMLVKDYPGSEWTARAKERMAPPAPAKKDRQIRKPPETAVRKAPAKGAPAEPPGTVKGIRYWATDAHTRIVVDLDKPLERFESHELKNPDRLVFDLVNSRMDPAMSKEPLVLNNGILRQVRSSQFDQATVRIVLDLTSIKSYVAFPLHEPARMVIDVSAEGTRNGGSVQPAPGGQGLAEAAQRPGAASNGKAAKEPSAGGDRLSLSRQLGLKVRTIAIDAGHGGHDPGAIGKSGLKEKVVTLDIAKRLASLVKERLGVTVIMTRDKDVFIPLEERPFIAKSRGSDLFVSIHVNANRKRKARGIETYIQSLKASDRDAMATAALENATSTKTLSQIGSELDRILKDLRTDDKQEESLQLAHAVQASLVDKVKPVQGHVVNLGVKRAFFYVLINTEMPSILAEVGFISNPEEEKLLKTEAYRQKVAEALFEGIKRYVEARGPQTARM